MGQRAWACRAVSALSGQWSDYTGGNSPRRAGNRNNSEPMHPSLCALNEAGIEGVCADYIAGLH